MTIGQRVLVGRNARFNLMTDYLGQSFNPSLVIGDDVYVGSCCEIVSVDRVEIGSGCVLSDNIYINDSSHGLDNCETLIMDRPLRSKGPVAIGAGCFVGRGAMILADVTLGECCVIGAGAVVTRSVPAYSMALGNPARIVARFDLEESAWIRVPMNACESTQSPKL